MANRSDFLKAKLPRSLKKMLAMSETYGWSGDEHQKGAIRRLFIEAHASHVRFKTKRQSSESNQASAEE